MKIKPVVSIFLLLSIIISVFLIPGDFNIVVAQQPPRICSDFIPASECEALAAFRNALDNGATTLSGWFTTDGNGNENPCIWRGVSCVSSSGNSCVHSLSPSPYNGGDLSGPISPALANFSCLVTLNLSSQQFRGVIPSQLSNLQKLESLSLSNNQLEGNIPSALGDLKNLKALHLSNNNLSGVIPAQLGNLQSLTTLSLDNNNLIGSIPSQLSNLQSLEWLSIRDNSLSGGIPLELGRLQSLQYVHLGNNQLEGNIPSELGNLQSLESVYLNENNLTGNIPSELGNLQSLETIYLSENNLTGNIPPQLGNLTNLRTLWLNSNQLDGAIPSDLGKLQNLSLLNLANNQLDGKIPLELGNMLNLVNVDLEGNKLSGGIPADLGKLQKLVALRLNDNPLGHNIPPELGSLKSLRILDLDETNLSGPIPIELGNLKSLTYLDLDENCLNGNIPLALGSLSLLEHLDVSENPLSGELPASLTSLSKLEDLNFNRTNLSEPEDSDFQTWLNNILDLERNVEPGFGCPLIFIPGMAGSYLIDRNNGNNELWPGIPTSQLPLSLYPEDNSSPGIIASDAIRHIDIEVLGINLKRILIYDPLLERLGKEGYREYQVDNLPERRTKLGCDYDGQRENYPNLFVFAYDWRQSNVVNAAFLKEYIECIQRFYPDQPVNILAHSMGGLLARRYILDNENDHNVEKLITIGSPWLGAPKAIYVLESGDFVPFTTNGTIKQIIGSFTGVHQLLPSQVSHGWGGWTVIEEIGWDFDKDEKVWEKYSYEDYINLVNKRYGRGIFSPGTSTEVFHNYATPKGSQDDWRNDATEVSYYHFVGVQSEDHTIARIVPFVEPLCNPQRVNCREPSYDWLGLKFTVGDGTVPYLSAARGAEAPGNINAPTAQVIRMISGINENTDDTVEHTVLASNPQVISEILKILASDPITTSVTALTNISPFTSKSAYYIEIFGAESIIVSDQLGNNTAPIPGTVNGRGTVPRVSTFILGEQAGMAILPTGGIYTITFQAIDEPMVIEIRLGTGSSTDRAIRYKDLNLPAGKKAVLGVTNQGIDNLRYDNDGDGIFESVVTPVIDVNGTAAQDVDPPTVSFQSVAQDSAMQVTIKAEDSGSGVKFLLYSMDGTNFKQYSTPLQVDPSITPVLYAFAEDNVANRSSLITYDFRQRDGNQGVYLPIVIKNR